MEEYRYFWGRWFLYSPENRDMYMIENDIPPYQSIAIPVGMRVDVRNQFFSHGKLNRIEISTNWIPLPKNWVF